MELTIYIDGHTFPSTTRRLSVFDHGLLLRRRHFRGHSLLQWSRLQAHRSTWSGCGIRAAIMLTIPMTMAEMEAAVLETIRAMACARDISGSS